MNSAQIDKTKTCQGPTNHRGLCNQEEGQEEHGDAQGLSGNSSSSRRRDELKGDYYFANRAQRLHARKSSNATRARLEAECRFLQSRVHEAIEKELADDPERVKERLEAVSKQATDFFSKIYMSIYDTALESAGKQATDAYDKAIEKLKAGAPGQCLQRAESVPALGASSAPPLVRASSAPALLVDALDVAPEFDKFVGRLTDAGGSSVERKRPPPKGAARIVEKCALRPGAPDDTSKVCDVNRDMIVCDTLGDLTYLLESLARAKDISVVRVKDRHNHPPPSKWRDVMVNIIMKSDNETHVASSSWPRDDADGPRGPRPHVYHPTARGGAAGLEARVREVMIT